MNIRELITELQELAEEHGDDIDVVLAHQPRWPFEHSIGEIVAVDSAEERRREIEQAIREDLEGQDLEVAKTELAAAVPDVKVFIGEGSQVGYLPGAACTALGWR